MKNECLNLENSTHSIVLHPVYIIEKFLYKILAYHIVAHLSLNHFYLIYEPNLKRLFLIFCIVNMN